MTRSIIFEKLPLIALSAFSSLVTILVQKQTVSYAGTMPIGWRINNAITSCNIYIWQMVWPLKLAVFYPHPEGAIPLWQIISAAALLMLITIGAWVFRARLPYLLTGWVWYCIALLPVIGIIQVGLQARADRYTYLPQIGLCVAVVWGVADLRASRGYSRTGLALFGGGVVAVLMYFGWKQTSFWRDSEQLWMHAVAVVPKNALAHNNAAALSQDHGDIDGAISHYEMALASVDDRAGESHWHLSPALLHENLAAALMRKGRVDDAISHCQQAIALRPDFADAHATLAQLLASKGELDEAIRHYEIALAIPPEDSASHARLGAALARAGRDAEAIAHYRRSVEMTPSSMIALNNLAWLLATSSDKSLRRGTEAVVFAERANALAGRENAGVLRTLAAAYAEAGRFEDAIAAAQTASRLAQRSQDRELTGSLANEMQLYAERRTIGELPK